MPTAAAGWPSRNEDDVVSWLSRPGCPVAPGAMCSYKMWMDPRIIPALLQCECFYARKLVDRYQRQRRRRFLGMGRVCCRVRARAPPMGAEPTTWPPRCRTPSAGTSCPPNDRLLPPRASLHAPRLLPGLHGHLMVMEVPFRQAGPRPTCAPIDPIGIKRAAGALRHSK